MVGHVLGKAAVLGEAGHEVMPGAVEPGQSDDHRRQDAARDDARDHDRGVDQQPCARRPIRLRAFGSGMNVCLLRGEPTGGMDGHLLEGQRHVEQADEVGDDVPQLRWAHGDDLRITTDDDRVGVVAGVAPSPHGRVAHDHEAGDVVDDGVHPSCLEGGAVTAFVPPRVGGRAVEHAVGREAEQRPHREPQVHAEPAEQRPAAPSHNAVSRMAGPLRRCMSSFIRLRGTAVRYHSACDNPSSTARRESSPINE